MGLVFRTFSQILLHLCALIYIVSQNTQLRENLDPNVLPAMANLFYWTGFVFVLKDGSKRDVGIFGGITMCILVIAHRV
jgi:hypothetical protein